MIPVGNQKQLTGKSGTGLKSSIIKRVATVTGQPGLLKGEGYRYSIFIEIENDVDISVGSIDYNGDVVIRGDVCDNYGVKATGTSKWEETCPMRIWRR